MVLRDGLAPWPTPPRSSAAPCARTAAAETMLGWLLKVATIAGPLVGRRSCARPWSLACGARTAPAEALLDRDELTGPLLTRGASPCGSTAAADRARRGVEGAAYLFLDLDGFKAVNDGPRSHHVGDQVLAELGGRLQRSVRVTDAVGRRGGDEFMVLFNGVRDERHGGGAGGADPGCRHGSRRHRRRAEARSACPSAWRWSVPGRRDFEPDLRGHADAAMYEAKAAGGGIRVWREPDEG